MTARGKEILDSYTPGEMALVSLVLQGMKYREAAKRLQITEQTVKNRMVGVFNKSGVDNRLSLLVLLRDLGVQ